MIAGREKWIVSLDKMPCTYYNQTGNKILVEHSLLKNEELIILQPFFNFQ